MDKLAVNEAAAIAVVNTGRGRRHSSSVDSRRRCPVARPDAFPVR